MATIVDRIRNFLRGPQGQRIVREGQKQLNKPENQRRLRQISERLRKRR